MNREESQETIRCSLLTFHVTQFLTSPCCCVPCCLRVVRVVQRSGESSEQQPVSDELRPERHTHSAAGLQPRRDVQHNVVTHRHTHIHIQSHRWPLPLLLLISLTPGIVVAIRLVADGFDRYSCPEPLVLCFNTRAMRNMLVLLKDKDVMKLSYSAKLSPDHLSMSFTSKLTTAHTMLLLADVSIEPLLVPQLEYGQRLLTTPHNTPTTVELQLIAAPLHFCCCPRS